MKFPFFTLTTGISLSIAHAGTDNEIHGTNAGGSQNGDRNVVIGDYAASNMNTADENTVIGAYAGLSLLNTTTSDQNTFLGFRANGLYTQSEWEAFLADSINNPLPDIDADGSPGLATANHTTSQSVMLGYQAGLRSYAGNDNTFVGFEAGMSNTDGYDNTYIGSRAGRSSTTTALVGKAYDNTFIGADAGYLSTYGFKNTFIGQSAGRTIDTGKLNVAVGERAMNGTTPIIVDGSYVFQNPTGSYNTAVGAFSLYDTCTSRGCTGVGLGAGRDNSQGDLNTSIGFSAGNHNERGFYNTFVGALAGLDNNRANDVGVAYRNTHVGMAAGSFNRNGNDNIYIGAFADMQDWAQIAQTEIDNLQIVGTSASGFNLPYTPTASNDRTIAQSIAVGAHSFVDGDDNVTLGYDITSRAPRAIAIGSTALVNDAAHENAIVIGYGAQSRAANLAVIGNASTTGIEPGADGTTALGSTSYRYASASAATFSAIADASTNATVNLTADAGSANDDHWRLEAANSGNFKIASSATGSFSDILTASNTGDVTISGNVTANSDRRLKQDIQPIANASKFLSQLSGKTYHWKPELGRDQRLQYGLIAQEVETVLPELVTTSSEDIKSVNYQAFVPLLIDSVNELKQSNAAKEKRLALLRQQAALQQQLIQRLEQQEKETAAH